MKPLIPEKPAPPPPAVEQETVREKNWEEPESVAAKDAEAPQMALAVYGDEPTFNADGYPTLETEETITQWDFKDGYHSLMAYVARAWKHPDYFSNEGNEYRISTGGWSGNESLIGALERNRVFWALCWESSKRGGHYVFTLWSTAEAQLPEDYTDNIIHSARMRIPGA